MGGSAPTATPITLQAPTPPKPPPGYDFAKAFFSQIAPQLFNQPLPSYGGQVDPGLSPTMENTIRGAQTYSQSPFPRSLEQASGTLGAFMGGAMNTPHEYQEGPAHQTLQRFLNPALENPRFPGPTPDYGFTAGKVKPMAGGGGGGFGYGIPDLWQVAPPYQGGDYWYQGNPLDDPSLAFNPNPADGKLASSNFASFWDMLQGATGFTPGDQHGPNAQPWDAIPPAGMDYGRGGAINPTDPMDPNATGYGWWDADPNSPGQQMPPWLAGLNDEQMKFVFDLVGNIPPGMRQPGDYASQREVGENLMDWGGPNVRSGGGGKKGGGGGGGGGGMNLSFQGIPSYQPARHDPSFVSWDPGNPTPGMVAGNDIMPPTPPPFFGAPPMPSPQPAPPSGGGGGGPRGPSGPAPPSYSGGPEDLMALLESLFGGSAPPQGGAAPPPQWAGPRGMGGAGGRGMGGGGGATGPGFGIRNEVAVPAFAGGSIVDRPQLAMIGEPAPDGTPQPEIVMPMARHAEDPMIRHMQERLGLPIEPMQAGGGAGMMYGRGNNPFGPPPGGFPPLQTRTVDPPFGGGRRSSPGFAGPPGLGMQSINGGGFRAEPFSPYPTEEPHYSAQPFGPMPMPMPGGGGTPNQVVPDVPGVGSGGRSAGMGSFGRGRIDMPRSPIPDRFRGATGMGGGNQVNARPAPGGFNAQPFEPMPAPPGPSSPMTAAPADPRFRGTGQRAFSRWQSSRPGREGVSFSDWTSDPSMGSMFKDQWANRWQGQGRQGGPQIEPVPGMARGGGAGFRTELLPQPMPSLSTRPAPVSSGGGPSSQIQQQGYGTHRAARTAMEAAGGTGTLKNWLASQAGGGRSAPPGMTGAAQNAINMRPAQPSASGAPSYTAQPFAPMPAPGGPEGWPSSPGMPPPAGGDGGAMQPFSPWGPTSAMDVYRSSVPVMNQAMEDAVSGAMASSGLTGNRFSSSARNDTQHIGGQYGLAQNQLMANLLRDQTNMDLDRALKGTEMGLQDTQFQNQLAFQGGQAGLDRMLQAAGLGVGAGQAQDQMAQDRLRLPFQIGSYEQGRQDQFSRLPYDEFMNSRLGFMPYLFDLIASQGGTGGMSGQYGVNQTAGTPGGLDYLTALAPYMALFMGG